MPALDGLWRQNLALLEPTWEQVEAILGDTGSVAPLVGLGSDGRHDAASFKTRRRHASGLEAVFSWQAGEGGPANWTNGNDFTSESRWQGKVPIVNFDGTDDEADTPDVAYWSRVGAPMSIAMWIKPADVTSITLLSKLDLTNAAEQAEWHFHITAAEKLQLTLYDNSAATTNWTMYRPSSASIVADVWTFVLATYDGDDAEFADINLYINGVASNGVGDMEAAYTAMENTNAVVALGYHEDAGGALANPYNGYIAGGPIGPCYTQKVVTAAEAKRLFNIGRGALGV